MKVHIQYNEEAFFFCLTANLFYVFLFYLLNNFNHFKINKLL